MANNVVELEERLGQLAMAFRRSDEEFLRNNIACEYGQIVQTLINSGQWNDVPAPEDQLPDEYMPPTFLQYWFKRYPAHS